MYEAIGQSSLWNQHAGIEQVARHHADIPGRAALAMNALQNRDKRIQRDSALLTREQYLIGDGGQRVADEYPLFGQGFAPREQHIDDLYIDILPVERQVSCLGVGERYQAE